LPAAVAAAAAGVAAVVVVGEAEVLAGAAACRPADRPAVVDSVAAACRPADLRAVRPRSVSRDPAVAAA
jgi:hypothetical protein